MKKFEYRVLCLSNQLISENLGGETDLVKISEYIQSRLQDYGDEGYELTHIRGWDYYFKKEITK